MKTEKKEGLGVSGTGLDKQFEGVSNEMYL